MRTLYPPIEPHLTGFLKVSDVHDVYYEESGNPGGIPAVGIVPNTEALDDDGLEDTLGDTLARHKDLFANGGLITTSCGCAALTEERAAKALDLSVRLSRRLQTLL